MANTVFLIRHGLTDWNQERRYCGSADIDLNGRGKKETRCLAKRLKRKTIDRVYASDRRRALRTAAMLFKRAEIEKMPDLREVCFGIFEGLTYGQIMQRYPVLYRGWLKNPALVKVPEAEDMRAFKKRVLRAFKRILACNYNQTAAVITHGGVISVFINSILKSGNFWQNIPDPGSLSIIEYAHGKAKIKLFNDTAHLLRHQ
ncbi:MAG: hypothetical protein A3G38_03815 [Omnitrophica WOR_2 bacterium RIFCSPLOWO2_12_FULL_51_8]|nr:MAG: hypothetical protein A3G38_03815 [Omnitrophica WOR_2 bacterium RIFCSPLOWO2_12_FULL_51_8]